MPGIARYNCFAIDCPSPRELADSYSAITGWPIDENSDMAIGARKHEVQPGTDFRVYLDPIGHPFCLVLPSD